MSSTNIRDLTDEELQERQRRHLLGLKAVFIEQERRRQKEPFGSKIESVPATPYPGPAGA